MSNIIEKNYFGSLFRKSGIHNTFSEVFPTFSDFYTDYINSPLPQTLDDREISAVYYLLYGKYKNSHIKGDDQDQFKARVFTIIFQHGPEFSKKLEIRDKIHSLDLSNDDWRDGSIQVHNMADHPSTSPGTLSMEEIDHIDTRNTTLTKKGVMEGYSYLYNLISTDVTQEFIDKFEELFSDIAVSPTILLFEVGDDEEDDD